MNDKNKNANNALQTQKKIVIAERDNLAAVLEGKKVTDFFIHKGDVLLGDVYLATVDNILPSIDAAFVNVGTDKMGFLHAQDVMGKGSLREKLSPKQKLVVQVVKEPSGHKGPRVTTEISLPGRFLVLMPNEPGVSISKKIENSRERARLKSVVNLIKPVGVGVIIRTEAEGQTESDIQEDLEILLEKWNNIVTSAESLTPPNLIYRDQDLLYRVIREACTDDVREIIVDTAFALNRVQNILQNWHMNKNIEVTLYKGNEPLLTAMDIHKEIKAALQTKVNMPSGGYLFIQTTEALTVIDVNSGKFISSATQDETILKTNKEAVNEIARQLRLRNIGGMIIVDFIDMLSRADKLAIMEELEIALEPDKSKPQVGQLSDLGLVELTRHRQGQSLAEIFTKKCPHCQGSGYSTIDFNFATPTAEGEFRAKAAKLKLPTNNFKKNNNSNNNNRNMNNRNPQTGQNPQIQQNAQPQIQETTEQQTPIAVEAEISTITPVQEAEKRDITKRRNNNNRRKKFDKPEQSEVQSATGAHIELTPTAENGIIQTEENKPTIEPQKIEAPNTAIVTQAPAPVIVAPQASTTPAPVQNTEAPAETNTEAPSEEKPTRTRRPNRGVSKKPRAKKVGEENVEVSE